MVRMMKMCYACGNPNCWLAKMYQIREKTLVAQPASGGSVSGSGSALSSRRGSTEKEMKELR